MCLGLNCNNGENKAKHVHHALIVCPRMATSCSFIASLKSASSCLYRSSITNSRFNKVRRSAENAAPLKPEKPPGSINRTAPRMITQRMFC